MHGERPSGFDFYVRETTTIGPKETALVPQNVAIQCPEGHVMLLLSRSSTPKKGLMLANSVGVIDYSYRGDGDEIKAFVYNFTDESVTIEKGDRIVQGLFMAVDNVKWNEQDTLEAEDRGGFGTTGK